MNVLELANKYRQEIPEGLDEESFLKALYVRIGRDRTFDEKYYFGNSETQKKIYLLAERRKADTKADAEKRTIICYSLSYIIKHLVEEMGYKCMVTPRESICDHVFPIVFLSDGRRIKFDVQRDLEFIQTNCRTRFFGTTENADIAYDLDTIDSERQVEIDKSIGYIEDESDYRDEAIQRLEETLKANPNLPIWQKLSIILSDKGINNIPASMGYIEAFKYYCYEVLPKFFTKKERTHSIHLITCAKVKPDDSDDKEYTNCIYVGVKNAPQQVYMFSRVYKRYIKTPFDDLIKLKKEGLKIGAKPPMDGVRKLLRALDEYELSEDFSKLDLEKE